MLYSGCLQRAKWTKRSSGYEIDVRQVQEMGRIQFGYELRGEYKMVTQHYKGHHELIRHPSGSPSSNMDIGKLKGMDVVRSALFTGVKTLAVNILSALFGLMFCTLILFAFLYLAYYAVSFMAWYMELTSGSSSFYGYIKIFMEGLLPLL